MDIDDGRVVFLNFELTDETGKLLDKSPEDEPMAYLHGALGILPALEMALQGKRAGDAFDVTIAPEQAYGEHLLEAVTEVPRAEIPAHWTLEIGMQVVDSSGAAPNRIITGITPDTVTLDANHPLAGVTLRFSGTVVEVREASREELDASS